MAGQLTVDQLRASTGVLASQNGMTGIAKAWVTFTGSSGTIAGSFNVSSITRNGTGNYTVNITTAMPNINYSVIASCSAAGSVNSSTNCVDVFSSAANTLVTPTTSAFNMFVFHPGNQVGQDTSYVTAVVLSS
jgi:hypothetical protein